MKLYLSKVKNNYSNVTEELMFKCLGITGFYTVPYYSWMLFNGCVLDVHNVGYGGYDEREPGCLIVFDRNIPHDHEKVH